jgi:flagellar assembly protein FliH
MTESLPRSQQSAWQRWELASLDASAAASGARAEADRAAAEVAAKAQADGYAQGYADGIAAAQAHATRLAQLLAALTDDAAAHEQRLADEVLDLALVFARQLVGEALSVRRELVLPIVAAALSQLPQSTRYIELKLNPADAELVRRILPADDAGVRVALHADASIAPGGCMIDTEQAAIDATVPARWRRLLAGLGRSDDWLEPA